MKLVDSKDQIERRRENDKKWRNEVGLCLSCRNHNDSSNGRLNLFKKKKIK